MSNFVFHVCACRPETLEACLDILLKEVRGWEEITKDGKIWLAVHDWQYQLDRLPNATKFPAPLSIEQATVMIRAWLKSKEPFEESGRGPDGGESKGYEIIAPNNRFDDPPCLIRPFWAWHAK